MPNSAATTPDSCEVSPLSDYHMTDQLDEVLTFDSTAEALPRLFPATALASARQAEWLAKGRLPLNAVAILVGDEGIGKSLLWVWVVAAVTTGRPLPEFGIPAREPGTVVLVLTEDEWAYTVRPRLDVAGADLQNVLVICTETDGSGAPVFPRDMHLIHEASPMLVVVDAFLDTVDRKFSMKDPQQARLALHPWKEAATATGASVLLLTHTNRVDSKSARDKYGITGELRKKARITLYAQEDEDGHLVVGPEKSNISRKIPASMFRIEPVLHWTPTEDDDGTVPKLVFVGESDKTAREHLMANYESAHSEESEDKTEAAAWLEDYLTVNGSVASTDAKTAARKVGISERSLKRASNSLGIQIEQKGFPRRTWWSLPSGATSGYTRSVTVPTGPTGPTAPDKGICTGPTAHVPQSGQWGHPQNNGNEAGLTVCRRCGEPMTVVEPGQQTHPGCEVAA